MLFKWSSRHARKYVRTHVRTYAQAVDRKPYSQMNANSNARFLRANAIAICALEVQLSGCTIHTVAVKKTFPKLFTVQGSCSIGMVNDVNDDRKTVNSHRSSFTLFIFTALSFKCTQYSNVLYKMYKLITHPCTYTCTYVDYIYICTSSVQGNMTYNH